MHNHEFWRKHFHESYVPHCSRLLETLERRLLPAFDNLDAEATKIQEDTYSELMHMPADENCEPSAMAGLAFDAAFEHYAGMSAIKQTLLNSFAPLLYHTWEQQLLTFHRREVLHHHEQHESRLLNLKTLRTRLTEKGVEVTALRSWSTIEELRLVANTVKHADGASAEQLKALRPDMFDHPSIAQSGLPWLPHPRRVYAPLSGDDLFVTTDDLSTYGRAVMSYWDEFADALAEA